MDRLTVTVAPGAILGIVGPANAGKTTLLSILGGRLLPSSGSAHVLGYDVWTQSEEIRSCALFVGAPQELDNPGRCEELLTTLQASIQHTPLVLLDEPAAGASYLSKHLTVYHRLEAIVRAAGATLVLTGVNVDTLESSCDSIGVLCRGVLLAAVPAAEIHTRCATRVEIRGRGFTDDVVALLRRRAHVWVATAGSDYLCLYLLKDLRHHTNSLSDSAPLVTLLVESGAEVEEVNRQLITLADLSTSAATTDLTP